MSGLVISLHKTLHADNETL